MTRDCSGAGIGVVLGAASRARLLEMRAEAQIAPIANLTAFLLLNIICTNLCSLEILVLME